jgi:lipoprotein-anchoring transpeptidase ErfK/SrfK
LISWQINGVVAPLYYVLPGKHYTYPISVGRQGFAWTGTERISRITSWPTWTPPPEMRQRQPGLPIIVSGGLINTLRAKALYLGCPIWRLWRTSGRPCTPSRAIRV